MLKDLVLGECEGVQLLSVFVIPNPVAAPLYTGMVLVDIHEGAVCSRYRAYD